jgi:hypothetical protein
MAASAITLPTNFTKRVINADIDHNDDSFRLVYLTSDPTVAINADDNWSAISGTEVANGNGYSTHGFSITTSTSISVGISKFTSAGSQVLSATGGVTVDWAAIVDTSISGITAECDATDIVVGFFELNDGSNFVLSNGDTLTTTLGDMYDLT